MKAAWSAEAKQWMGAWRRGDAYVSGSNLVLHDEEGVAWPHDGEPTSSTSSTNLGLRHRIMSQIVDAPSWWSRDVVVHCGASSRRSSAGGGRVGGGMDVARPPRRAPDCGDCPGDPVMAAHALPCHTMVVAALAAPLRYLSFGMTFCYDYYVKADCNTTLFVKYTNRADRVEYCIGGFKHWLQNDNPKIVGLDVEYTWPSGPTQRAAVLQLCVGDHVLVYQISKADGPCYMLGTFLRDMDYTFAGVDIGNDRTMLGRVGLEVENFVDIQTKWRVPKSDIYKVKDGLAEYAASIIHCSYSTMKIGFTQDDHQIWAIARLPLKNIYYASMDAYATYEVYRRLVNFEKGLERLHQPIPPRRSWWSKRKN